MQWVAPGACLVTEGPKVVTELLSSSEDCRRPLAAGLLVKHKRVEN